MCGTVGLSLCLISTPWGGIVPEEQKSVRVGGWELQYFSIFLLSSLV